MTKSLKTCLGVAALAFTVCASCRAAGKTVTLAQYDNVLQAVQNRLDTAANAVENGDGLVGESPGAATKRTLGSIDRVRMPDGSLLNVDTKSIADKAVAADGIKDEDAQAGAYGSLSRQVDFLRNGVRSVERRPGSANSGNSVPPASKSKAVAREVLGGSEFTSEPVPPPSWFEQEMKRFGKWLDRAMQNLFKARGPKGPNLPTISPNVMKAFVWILAAALFGLLVWIVVQLIGRRQARARPLSLSSTEEALVEARDKDTLLTLAEKHARAGDHRYAFRLVYLATLIVLDTEGVLRFDRSKTNWEYVRALRNSGRDDVYDILAPLTREFDRIWYGLSPAGPEVYRSAVREYEKLTEPAPEKTTAATA